MVSCLDWLAALNFGGKLSSCSGGMRAMTSYSIYHGIQFQARPCGYWSLATGYGFADGFRVVFSPIEPDETLWVIAVMRSDEEITEVMKRIFQARLNVILERKDISHNNPFGDA